MMRLFRTIRLLPIFVREFSSPENRGPHFTWWTAVKLANAHAHLELSIWERLVHWWRKP
jgi:hypothetical protein